MTRAEATTLALQIVGAIGCGAGVSAGLVALDAEDTAALWAAGRIIGVGILALFAADTAQDDGGDGAKRRKRSV